MKENMAEEIDYFENKFKYKSIFTINENLLSREFKVNFLNNKNKVLDVYSEISIKIDEVKDKDTKNQNKKVKRRKVFKKRKSQKK